MTIAINASAARERRDNQTHELTEVELSKVTGGSQSSGAGAGKRRIREAVSSIAKIAKPTGSKL